MKSLPDKDFIDELLKTAIERGIKDSRTFYILCRKVAAKTKVQIPTKQVIIKRYRELIASGDIERDADIEQILRVRQVRSLSGLVVISVLTKPYACPGNCLYCPSQPGNPKSYLSDEPAVMRAIACDYDPYRQVIYRLKALENNGHEISKVSMRIVGGTWSFYPKRYQTSFVKALYRACNNYRTKGIASSLVDLQIANETAEVKMIELSVETRQDYINPAEIKRLRQYGVTKVELGVQSIYDDVLKFNRRGHDVARTVQATKLLKDSGFKVSYQVMLNLPGSTIKRDKAMIQELFNNPDFKPDHLKIYPLAILKEAPLYPLYLEGKIKAYSKAELMGLLKWIKINTIPYWCRIERVIRDIPSQDVLEGGAKVSNMRQLIMDDWDKEFGRSQCKCIRCREARERSSEDSPAFFRDDYDASDGKEIFLSYESKDRQILYAMLRMRIPERQVSARHFNTELRNAALIREMHTFGRQVKVDAHDKLASQHKGLGTQLLAKAQEIAKDEFNYNIAAAIAGVGVRNFFRKNGFELAKTYMLKKLK